MAHENSTAGRAPRLLLVEDDATTRALIARRLESRGCDVTDVDAAEEAIVEAGETKFDVVVSDVHLPGLSGIELTGFLLSQDPELPVILITGDRDETLAREALSRGPVSYLVKPFEPFEIEAAVRQALTRRGWTPSATAMGERPSEVVRASVPSEWLEFVDQESFAGPGHGERVARIALALLESLPLASKEMPAIDLALAARTHEVGRLSATDAEPPMVAMQSAELMSEAGFPRTAVRAVRHMHERWDGAGGPDGLKDAGIPLGAQIIAVADALDHYVSAWLQAGLNADNAVDRAVHLVTVQQEQLFSPSVVGAVHRQTELIRETIAETLTEPVQPSLTTASYVSSLSEVPFQAA